MLTYLTFDRICFTAIECPFPPDIENGMVSYDSDMIPNFGLGTKAIYSCNASDSVKTCMVDGNEIDVAMWSGQNLHCARSHYSHVHAAIHTLRYWAIGSVVYGNTALALPPGSASPFISHYYHLLSSPFFPISLSMC